MRRGNGEGSVFRRRDGRFVAAITLGYDGAGRRQRKTAVASSKREANQRLAELQRAAEQGLALDDPTVGEYLQRWLNESARPRLRPRTYSGYASIVNGHLVPGLGRIKLRKLTPADVDIHLRRTAEAGLSSRTLQYHRAVLRAALSQAERWGLVSRNVARLVTLPPVRQRELRPLSLEQARQFLDGVEGDRLATLYHIALTLGLRQSEVLGLQWAAMDFEARTLTVRHTLQRYGAAYHLDQPKTQRSRRVIILPQRLVDALRQHRDRQTWERQRAAGAWEADWDLVFCDELGRPLDGTGITRQFQRHLDRLGLPRQRFHDLRHAAATFLIAQGEPIRLVMEVLGHSSIATTMNVYGHIMPEFQRDATDRLAVALSGTS